MAEFDIEEFRELVGVPTLQYGREAEREGEEAIPEINLTNVQASLAVDSQISTDPRLSAEERERNLARLHNREAYGPACNVRFVSTFMRENPLLSQFVVYNCGAGVFGMEVHHKLSGMMVQLLSYLRYSQSGYLSPKSREARSQYQSYAMAELFGPFIPAERRCDQRESRRIIVEAVKYGLRNADFLEQIVGAGWFNDILGDWENENQIDLDRLNINQALAILMGWAANNEPDKEWLDNMNIFLNVIVALTKRGNVTDASVEKIKEGVAQDLGVRNVYVLPPTCAAFYQQFGKWVTDTNAEGMFDHYRTLVPAWSLRMTLTLQQAAGSGLTVFTLIKQALIEFSDFDWARLYQIIPSDFNKYETAAATVGTNNYYGFRSDIGDARATNFPSLGYAAQQLLIKAGGQRALSQYMGLKTGVRMKAELQEMVEQYVNRRATANPTEEELNQNRAVIQNIRASLGIA